MAAAQLRFEMRDDGVLALLGELTFATVAQGWRDARERLQSGPEWLDLAGVEHGDSAGLACVLALLADGRRVNPTLRVAHAPESLRSLARVSDTLGWIDDQA